MDIFWNTLLTAPPNVLMKIRHSTLTPQSVALLILMPHVAYNCCVFAVNEVGLGDPACQTVVTYEAGIMYGTKKMNHMLGDCLQCLISYNLHMI